MTPRRALAVLVAGLLALLVGAVQLLAAGAAGAQERDDRATQLSADSLALLPAPAQPWVPPPDELDAAPAPIPSAHTLQPRPALSRPAALSRPTPLACPPCPPARGPPAAAS